MKFSCEKAQLLEAISTASRAVTTRSTIALLEGLRITATDQLTLAGYDLSIGIKTKVEADIVEPGEVVLSAKLLGDIVRKLPDDVIWIDVNKDLMTTIKCGRSIFNLIAQSSENYPALPEVDSEREIELPQKTLKNLINKTVFAVSDNMAKPIHTGCLFETEGDRLTVVGVDGFRLAIRRETLTDIPSGLHFVVGGAALREIERILSEESEDSVLVSPGENHILFRMGQTELIARLISGEFLNYNAAIPADLPFTVSVDTRQMIQTLERVSLLVSEKLKNPVRIRFDGDVMKMTCITQLGKSYDECPIGGTIDDLEIGFNSRYLLDAFRATGEDAVRLSVKGALSPIVLTPIEGDEFTYLVLPVRLKADA